MVISDGRSATDSIIVPNITVPAPTPTVTPNVTAEPNVTVPLPTPTAVPNVSVEPTVTVPIPTSTVTPNVTTEPNVTVPSPTPTVTPNVTTEPNGTIVPAIVADENVTQGTMSNLSLADINIPIPTYTPKQSPSDTQVVISVVTTEIPTNGSNKDGFFGDIYDKIIAAAILGFVGLFYEIIKIKYEHKQKAKTEQINEDTQNKLLEKLERRQEELLAGRGNSDKKHDEPLSKPERQKEDIGDQNKNT